MFIHEGEKVMEIFLRRVSDIDSCKIQQWIEDIDASRYMSRFYPKAYDGKVKDIGMYLWFIIVEDNYDIGTIWVEKESIDDKEVTLGIFIGVKDKQGYGIGQIAIKKIIDLTVGEWKINTIKLNVRKNNERAIKCYKRYGFLIIGEGMKLNQDGQSIDFYKMKYELT